MIEMPFNCGCENREEIMGAGQWHLDASMVIAAIVITGFILLAVRKNAI